MINKFSIYKTNWMIIIGSLFLALIASLGIITPSFQFISLSACLLFIIILPFWGNRQIDWFSTWNFVCYSAFIGVFLRSIYITFDYPSFSVIQRVFLQGLPKEFLLGPMFVVLFGMSFMTLGYIIGPRVSCKIPFRIFRSDRWNEQRFLFLIIVLQLLAWIGIYFFIIKTSGTLNKDILFGNISALRGVSSDLTEYRAYSYLRWMASLSELVCYLLASKVISSRRLYFRDLILFLLSLSTSLFFYYFVSSRGGIIFILVKLLALFYYIRSRKLNLKRIMSIVVIAIGGLFLVNVISGLRSGYGFNIYGKQNFLLELFNPIILTRTFLDVSKTGHIMKAIPEILEYQWGKTWMTILFAWIPRDFWPGKPVVNIDNILGMVLYGASSYGSGGLPPGIIAEAYWNFSFPGIIAACFAVGFLLKIIYVNFRAYSNNRNIILLYVVSFMLLGMSFVGSNFTGILIGFIKLLLPLYIVLNIITQPKH